MDFWIFLLVTNLFAKIIVQILGPCPGNNQWFYISRGTVHLFRHTSPILFLLHVICSFLSQDANRIRLVSSTKTYWHKERVSFSDSWWSAGGCVPDEVVDIDAESDVHAASRWRKTRELWPNGCCAPQTMISVYVKSYA